MKYESHLRQLDPGDRTSAAAIPGVSPRHTLPPRHGSRGRSPARLRDRMLAIALLVAGGPEGFSDSVRLQWDANTEPDIAGYRLQSGATAGKRPQITDIGLTTETEVHGLVPGRTYYFTVTAYNVFGLESGPSEEVSYSVPAPGSPSNAPDGSEDLDANGLPDTWEETYGLKHRGPGIGKTPAAANDDSDGDGLSNLEEFLAGTDPLDSTDTLQLRVVNAGTAVPSILLPTVPGRRYQVIRNADFPAGTWEDCTDVLDGIAGSLEYADATAASLSAAVYSLVMRPSLKSRAPVAMESPFREGFLRLPLAGNSDTFVTLPFLRSAVTRGIISSISGQTLQVVGCSAWSPGRFVRRTGGQPDTYYVLMTSGALDGARFTITGNDATTFTLNATATELAQLAPGDRIQVGAYWTLATVFPDGQGIHASTSALRRATEILVFNPESSGINLSPAQTYYYLKGHWYRYGSSEIRDDTLLPEAGFIVRHNVPTGTTLTVQGGLLETQWRQTLSTLTTGKQDNLVGLPRPTVMTLKQSGLIESGAFLPSWSRIQRSDEVLLYDNAQPARNKAPSAAYYFFAGHWEKYGEPYRDAGDDPVLLPGTPILIRKAPATSGGTWVNPPNY